MTVNKGLLIAIVVLLVACLVGALGAQGRIAGLKADLATQTTRAKNAETRVAALEVSATYRETQISALQGQALLCEEARSRDAANAAERRAIIALGRGAVPPLAPQVRDGQSPIASKGPARQEERQSVQGGATPPRACAVPEPAKKEGNAHDAARRAVAARLNRPL